jgi:ABC-type antimicrobial peptide transport system permease subunit
LPLAEIKTMEARVDDAMWRTRAGAWLLGAFAFLALLLTAIGIFGVVAQSGAQRTAEIGVRMALGARSSDVVRLMLRRAAVVTGTGVAAGLVAALGLTRLLESMLYGVRAHDPLTFAAVAMLLASVACLACYLPARRAARVDAVVALRSE